MSVNPAPPPAPAPAPAPAPPAGGGAPAPAGGGGGGPAPAPIALGATKGAGGAGGGGGGNSAQKQDFDLVEIEEHGTSLGADTTIFQLLSSSQLTVQAAMERLQQQAARPVRRRNSLGMFRGLFAPQILSATVSLLESMHAPGSVETDSAGAVATGPATLLRSNLLPALAERSVDLAPDEAPKTDADRAHLLELTTDPRAGFAPEGLAAWRAERARTIRLRRSLQGRNDFVEAGSGARWWVVVGNGNAEVVMIRRAAREADLAGIHLLLDGVNPGSAKRLTTIAAEVAVAHPRVQIHVSAR